MSINIENKELSDLLDVTDIRIPRIQRDYAQGRSQESVQKIRTSFVSDLVAVIKGEREGLNLDFVYGSYEGTPNSRAFEPLDGQQRLTTLYLLHWLLGKEFTYGFTYATRPTSTDFFLWFKNELKVDELIKEWNHSNNKDKEVNTDKEGETDVTFSAVIKNQENYRWQWQYDPTIQGVLVMLDEMIESFGKEWLCELSELSESRQQALENLSKISFEFLDLKDLGLSKSLYVKMNARGKQLSDFDILKSTLEQDILRQMTLAKDEVQREQLLIVQKKWREKIDTEWVDALWSAYAKEQIRLTTLGEDANSEENRKKRKNIANNVEDWLHRLLLVFISRQLFLSECETISDLAYNRKIQEMRQTLDVYLQAHLRKDSSMCDIDYSALIDDIDRVLAFANIDGFVKPIILALPENSYIEKGGFSYLDYLTAWDRGIDVVAILHAIIKWLEANPIPILPGGNEDKNDIEGNSEDSDKSDIAKWKEDFEDWTRFARNILSNDNNYNRLDSVTLLREAIKGINSVIERFFTPGTGNTAVPTDTGCSIDSDNGDRGGNGYKSVVERIASMPVATQGVYVGLDNASINEEIAKAKLKINDPVWLDLIREAEDRNYVWGQIRWLLVWSKTDNDNGDEIDRVRFADYSERFDKVRILGTNGNTSHLFRAAMLIMGYDDFEDTDYRTFIFNTHRDNSMKRYLRYSTNVHGERFKKLIDSWVTTAPDTDVETFCTSLINTPDPQWPLWLKAVCLHPEVTNEQVWDYFIRIDKGHTCLQRKKTIYGGYNDPVLKHLWKTLEGRLHQDIKDGKLNVRYYDSRQETPNRVELIDRDPQTGNEAIRLAVYWGPGNNEYILETEGSSRTLTEDELIQISFVQ